MNQTRLKTLSILKGIGIIMIIIVHNRHFIMNDMNGLRQLINYCQMGCQIFLMVSGTALCYSWFKQKSHNYFSFILHRYIRLAPGFLMVLSINLILNYLFIDVFQYSPGYVMNRDPLAILANVFFVHGFLQDCINSVFPGGWYIGTTFILYLLFPLIITLYEKLYSIHNRLVILPPLIFYALNLLFMAVVYKLTDGTCYPYNNSFLYFLFVNQLPCFSLGITLYYLEKNYFSAKCPIPTALILSVFFGLTSIYMYLKPSGVFIYTLIPFLAGLAFFWLATAMLHMEHKYNDGNNTPRIICRYGKMIISFLESCGNHSYGMYLTHAFVCWYGIKFITDTLKNQSILYNDLILYMVLLIPSLLLVYLLGILTDKLVNNVFKKRRKV